MCTRKGYAASVSQLTLATAALYFPLLIPHSWGKRSAVQPKTIGFRDSIGYPHPNTFQLSKSLTIRRAFSRISRPVSPVSRMSQ